MTALPETMRALRKTSPRAGATLERIPVPRPGPGDVLDGGFAEYVVVPERNTWEVDPRIPPDVASIHDPFGNAVHTAFAGGDASDLATSAVAVLGCGPIGLFAVGIARAVGARQVIAVEPNDYRRDLAKRMGADLTIDPSSEDPVAAVLDATGG